MSPSKALPVALLPPLRELSFSRQPHRTDVQTILIRVVEDAVLGVAAAAGGTFEGDQRPGVRTGQRVIVDDEVRAQSRLTAHGEGTVGRRTDTEVGRVVEHLASLRRVAVGVRRRPACVADQTIVLHDRARAVGVHAAGRVEQGLQVEHGVQIVADLLLAAQTDERGAHLVGGDAEVRTIGVLLRSGSPAGRRRAR